MEVKVQHSVRALGQNRPLVITPCRHLILCADNRKEMEEWMAALRSVQNRQNYESTQYSMDHFSGMHNWYACSHARPTYCNVCKEALSGVTSHGLSCEVCKFKAHKRCAVRATNNCKWTTLASIGKDIIEDEDGVSMPHQWLEGNLPVSAKCSVCDKTCGSVLRLQDWRCLWCKAMVHSGCKEQLSSKCPLGQCKVSVIPPTALNSIDSDGFWKASCPPSCTSPLLVFVNSKSGDNQGVKFLRRFKQLLNPAQVFDLMNGGPHLGLRLFQKFDTFRILVCGGDGSVGWVLSEIDALTLHKQCQMGVLPLGTGNDLARVLGWGSACDDDTQLPQILEKLERASTKMLDRWSIMVYETKFPRQHSASTVQQILTYEDSVAAHLTKILTSDQHSVVISSAKVLCETVKDFVARVGKAYEKNTENLEESEAMAKKVLNLKPLLHCKVLL
uniref:diacylglycerol kinase (ATP) n=1 Tax=Xiphophorus couchianus TaxID=32473 RepID=A0A3B5M587_9TELE